MLRPSLTTATVDPHSLEPDDGRPSEEFLYETSIASIGTLNTTIGGHLDDGEDELDGFLRKLVAQPDEQLEVDETVQEQQETTTPIEHNDVANTDNDNGSNNDNSLYSSRPGKSLLVSFLGSDEEDEDDEDDDDVIDTLPITDGPLPHPSYSLTESLVAKKLLGLSMKKREEVFYDIHGVQDVVDEDSEEGFVDRKLSEMGDWIQKKDASQKTAYEMARTTNKEYVDNKDFRLRFLRADRFNPQLAATRYTKHYQTKLELFGEDKLGRDILQDDLDKDSLDHLYSGLNQTLPRRDNAGRLVWVWISGPQQQNTPPEAMYRRMFYNNMLISEDVETQRKGSVGVFYTLNRKQTRRGSKGNSVLRRQSGLAASLPMPIVAIHFCYNDYTWLPILSIGQLAMHLFVRLRCRAHYGTHAECMYKLQTFGIPVDTIPLDNEGNHSREGHVRCLEKRRQQEREWQAKKIISNNSGSNDKKDDNNNSNSAFVGDSTKIFIPARFDVLLGRGRGYFNHVGNIRYRVLIADIKERYDKTTTKKAKMVIADEVLQTVHATGGRFLKDNGGEWIPIDDKAARGKISHSFRALRASKSEGDTVSESTKSSNREERGNTAPEAKRMCRD